MLMKVYFIPIKAHLWEDNFLADFNKTVAASDLFLYRQNVYFMSSQYKHFSKRYIYIGLRRKNESVQKRNPQGGCKVNARFKPIMW